jgi:hypothetical protein
LVQEELVVPVPEAVALDQLQVLFQYLQLEVALEVTELQEEWVAHLVDLVDLAEAAAEAAAKQPEQEILHLQVPHKDLTAAAVLVTAAAAAEAAVQQKLLITAAAEAAVLVMVVKAVMVPKQLS